MTVPMRPTSAPMQRADLHEVATLFNRAFRDGRPPDASLIAYFEALFFGSPLYDPAHASLVHRAADGRLDSALLVVLMAVSVGGRTLTGRLMCSYMTDPGRRTRGGADLVLTIRARNQDFCFSDSATHLSADHWKAVGGHVLPIQSLDFRRILRPLGFEVARKARRLGPLALLARGLATLGDRLLRRVRPALIAAPGSGEPLQLEEFLAAAPDMVERFAVRPVWSEGELRWQLDMAAQNTVSGPLHLRGLRDATGALVGASVFYAAPGHIARVLNILAQPGHEASVITDLIGHCDAMGCVAVEGMAQPFAMDALARQPRMGFVPRGFFCISTRHQDIVDAARRGDVYLGGLIGEDWSRLVTDFHD